MVYKLFFDASKKLKHITYGCVLYENDIIIHSISGQIKSTFLNTHMAEYTALIMGLLLCISLKITNVEVYGDAKGVIDQLLDGKFKSKKTFYPFFLVAKTLSTNFQTINFTWISRDNNEEADELTRKKYDG